MGFYQKLRIRIRAHRFLHRSEADECQFMLACLQTGMTALDIGAHKAAYTYWMSRYLGKTGQVLAFEPVPELAKGLQQYADSCQHQNITVFRCALSDDNGQARLRIPRQDFMWSTLNYSPEEIDNPTEHCTYVPIETMRLDSVLNVHHSERSVGFIKCDVEGHEHSVLLGAKETLRTDQPVLLLESSPLCRVPAVDNASFELLNELGYQGYFFFDQALIPIEEHNDQTHQRTTDGIQNFVFIHPERWELSDRCSPYQVVPRQPSLRAAA